MAAIRFKTQILRINQWRILRIPPDASRELPSRGMVMVRGTMNGVSFEAALEPDGAGSHWFQVSDALADKTGIEEDIPVSLVVEPMKDWFEPDMPADLQNALTAAGLLPQWKEITTRARWEWLRWIRFTNNDATRQKRIEVTCSKLASGKRRPCCFDLARCTVTAVSKNGVLLDIE